MRAAFALALLLPNLAFSATPSPVAQTWPIDPTQSQAQFSVRKFWLTKERGTFPQLQGTLRRIDTQTGADLGQVAATLDVDKLLMDDPGHRARALGPGFFDAVRFPRIRFNSDPFPLNQLVTGGTLRGTLSLHGEEHPVALTLKPSDCPRQPFGCMIRVHGTISRSTFGMRAWRGVLSDNVRLDLRIVLGDRR